MADGMQAQRPTLLVLASTYPRWEGDPEPGFVHELAKRLVEHFHVVVVGPHAPGALTQEVIDGVEIHRYRYAPVGLQTLVNNGGIVTNLRRSRWKLLLVPGFLLAQLWCAWRLVNTRKVDLIHAHWLIPQGLLAAILRRLPGRKVPFVATSHGTDLYSLRARPMQILKRWVVSEAAAVTVVSTAMREELLRIGADVGKASVQPMGVDLATRFTPDRGVPRSNDEILFVGRLVKVKGLRYLINAMPEILRLHPHAVLTIVGFGPERQALQGQAERLSLADRVRFVGAVPQAELPALYRRAAVFVAPFVESACGGREGLGLVCVEAAGCECPVVVSDTPAVRDVFGEREALFVKPGNVKELAAAIASRLGSKGAGPVAVPSKLLQRFDWREVANRYAKILAALGP